MAQFRLVYLLSVFLILACFACQKEKDYSSSNINVVAQDPDTMTKVIDTDYMVVGDAKGAILKTYNHRLDLTASDSDQDTAVFNVTVHGVPRVQLMVCKGYSFNADSTERYKSQGIYFKQLDKDICVGSNKETGWYGLDARDTMNVNTMSGINYSPDWFYSPSRMWFVDIPVGINNSVATEEGMVFWRCRRWRGLHAEDTFGSGYIGFRYLEGEVMKYGWIRVDLESELSLTVQEVAYMK